MLGAITGWMVGEESRAASGPPWSAGEGVLSALPLLLCKQTGFCVVPGALKLQLPRPCHCVLHFGHSFPTVALAWSPEHPRRLWSSHHGPVPERGGFESRTGALRLPCVLPDSWSEVKVDCEPSWQPFQSNCYRLVGEKKSWQEAKKTCLRSGGDLVSIHTLSELEFVTKQIKQGKGAPTAPAAPFPSDPGMHRKVPPV